MQTTGDYFTIFQAWADSFLSKYLSILMETFLSSQEGEK